jgi:glycosyltransferase involved in cell wall biosynthesis
MVQMRVAYFSNQISMSFGYGVKRYSLDLLEHLNEKQALKLIPISTWSDLPSEHLAELKSSIGLEVLGLGRYLNMLSWTYLNAPKIERLSKHQFDILHTTFLGHPVPTGKKSVATIHDIAPLLYSSWFPAFKNVQLSKALEFGLSQYDCFICVSKFTESTFLNWVDSNFPKVSVKTKVIYEGVNKVFKDIPTKEEIEIFKNSKGNILDNFILLVGKSSYRKNYKDVILALNHLRSELDLHLVVVGSDGSEEGLLDLVSELQLADRVHFMGYVDNQELKLYYAACTALIYPSLFEGFGLPLIEAMSLGSIVIWPDNSSISEIAQNQGIRLEELSMEGIVQALRELNELNEFQRDSLSQKAVTYSREFDWNKTADEVYTVYEELLNK